MAQILIYRCVLATLCTYGFFTLSEFPHFLHTIIYQLLVGKFIPRYHHVINKATLSNTLALPDAFALASMPDLFDAYDVLRKTLNTYLTSV
jgi:hypothetical protein